MTRKKSNILLVTVIFLSLSAGAQFRYTALLDTVKATGFYNIPITSALSGYLKTDLSDLRVVDEKKQAIPFIIDIPAERKVIDPVPYDQKIIRKENDETKTILVIENEGKKELSDFVIELKSAAAERTASLSGSDDNANWFAILDSLLLHKSSENNNASHSQRINFPTGNYKFFRLIIKNGNKAPLNILNARSHGINSPYGTPELNFVNPTPSISQTDSSAYSLIKVVNDKPYHVGSFKLAISGPWLYKRQAKLFTELKQGLQQTWNSHSHAIITISSDEFSGYRIPNLTSTVFYLLIENGDNPPLKIDSITTEMVKRRVIAQLEKGRTYSLLLDNPEATAPDYDLQHFRDKIPDNSAINIQNIIALPLETIPVKKQANKWWIWPVIILVLLLLSILAWKLTTDMKRTSHDKAESI